MATSRFRAILSLRCSHCRQGKVFRSLWQMHEACPVCGTHFERESGYFLNAIFFGYVVVGFLLLPVIITGFLIEASVAWFIIASLLTMIVTMPLTVRYSRVIWLHVDELLDPRPEPPSTES